MFGMLHSARARAVLIVGAAFGIIILATTIQALRERNGRLAIAEAELYQTTRVIVRGAQSTVESTHLLFPAQLSVFSNEE